VHLLALEQKVVINCQLLFWFVWEN